MVEWNQAASFEAATAASDSYGFGNRTAGSASSERRESPSPEGLLDLASKLHKSRVRRGVFFSPDLFSEPGWEMLFALYRADAAGHRLTVSNLCFASQGPDTTALRWIDKLLELHLVFKKKNPLDARSYFIELEPEARIAVHAYLLDQWLTFYGAKSSASV